MEILLLLPLLMVGGIIAMIVSLISLSGRVKRAEMRIARIEAEARSDAPRSAAMAGPIETVTAPVAPVPVPMPRVPEPIVVPVAAEPSRRKPVVAARAAPLPTIAAPAPAATVRDEGPTTSVPDDRPAAPMTDDERAARGQKRPVFSFEDFFGRRLPIWAGGITLAVAGVLIVNYALAAGLLTPWVQVAAALMFGFGLLAGAEAAQQNKLKVGDPRVAQALAGAGLATLYAAVFVAGNVHGLIPAGVTFAAMATVTAGALALASRFGAPTALLALAGGFATPALIESADPNIPLLAGYLALTVAGLTAVGRGQRWAWLGTATLAGGGLWTLVLIANGALDLASTLSVGALVILLAVAVPLLGTTGPRAGLVRTLAMLVGLAQLGALVATGGFAMETWAMYALIAAAGQWLAWRERGAREPEGREPGFAIVPRLSAGLTAVLLVLWPDPSLSAYAIVGLAMLAIHAVPLHLKLWTARGGLPAAADLSVIAIATLVLPWLKFSVIIGFEAGGLSDAMLTALAIGAAAVSGFGLVTGWRSAERTGDRRYAQLATVSALLVAAAAWFGLPEWSFPAALAALCAVLLAGGERAADARFERVALGFAALAVMALAVTGSAPENDWQRMTGVGSGGGDLHSLLRWGAVCAAATLVAWRARFADVPKVAQVGAAGLAYGTLAQVLPVDVLLLTPGVALVGLALASRRLVPDGMAWPRLLPAMAVAGLLLAGWAAEPLARWTAPALASLAGVPMLISDGGVPPLMLAIRQLLVPGVLLGVAAWLLRGQLEAKVRRALAVAGVLVGVAVHIAYRQGFDAVFDEDFIATGIVQRLVWAAVLLGGGLAIARSATTAASQRVAVAGLAGAAFAHASWYGLILHNPLWWDQAVGAVPVLNWLVPLYALPALAAWVGLREHPKVAARFDLPIQVAAMLVVVLLAFSTLRQAFAGSLLMAEPVGELEDVLRSVLAILLAIGFLLWGARSGRRDWRIASLVLMLGAVAKVFLLDAAGLEGLARIASFVALGFSLIGIGWFYSRQLRVIEPNSPGHETAP